MWFDAYNWFLAMLWDNPQWHWFAVLLLANGATWFVRIFIP
jgi:hypothetical protein